MTTFYIDDRNNVVYKTDSKGNKIPFGEITEEKVGDMNMVVKLDAEGKQILNEAGDTIPAGLADVREHSLTTYFRQNGKTSIDRKLRPYEKPLDLSEFPIKLYDDQRLINRVSESLKYSPEKGKKKKLTPLGQEILNYIAGIRKDYEKVTLKEFEGYINDMRNGSLEDQAIFLLFRQHLIENDLMAVNSRGYAYDLSEMNVPPFTVTTFLDHTSQKDPELLEDIMDYYVSYTEDEESKGKRDFISCIEQMKAESPHTFVRVYHYLIDNKFIIPKLNLTEDQFRFLYEYDIIASAGGIKQPVMPHISTYLQKYIKTPKSMDVINKTIEQMQYGSSREQEVYQAFCTMIKEIHNVLLVDEIPKQSSKTERAKLIKKAKAKAQSKTDALA